MDSFTPQELAYLRTRRLGRLIRGAAEALVDVDPPRRGMSREEIRVRPERVISWGLEGDVP